MGRTRSRRARRRVPTPRWSARSLGGEVVLEAASRDRRLAAVVADGAARPMDANEVTHAALATRALVGLATQSLRAISGMKPSSSLVGMMPRIAPRPVLLVAAGRIAEEPLVARRYQRAGGSGVQVWEVQGAGHTAGLRKHPAAYEDRTVGFLDAGSQSGLMIVQATDKPAYFLALRSQAKTITVTETGGAGCGGTQQYPVPGIWAQTQSAHTSATPVLAGDETVPPPTPFDYGTFSRWSLTPR